MNNLIAEHHGITDLQLSMIFRAINTLKAEGNNITYLEIGVLYGGVLRRVLEKLDNLDFAIGVDLFEDLLSYDGIENTHKEDFCYKKDLQEVLEKLGFSNFILHKGDSSKIVPTLDKIDNGVIVIDANHTYEGCKIDFNNAYNILNNGFIFLHDTDWEGPERVGNEIISSNQMSLAQAVFGAAIFRKN